MKKTLMITAIVAAACVWSAPIRMATEGYVDRATNATLIAANAYTDAHSGGGIDTNAVKALIETEAGPTNAIVHLSDDGGITASYVAAQDGKVLVGKYDSDIWYLPGTSWELCGGSTFWSGSHNINSIAIGNGAVAEHDRAVVIGIPGSSVSSQGERTITFGADIGDIYVGRGSLEYCLEHYRDEAKLDAIDYTDSATNGLLRVETDPTIALTNRTLTVHGQDIEIPDASGEFDPADPAFSNAVLSVALPIGTNELAVLREIGDLPIGEGASGIGALLAALATAVVWLKRKTNDAFLLAKTANDSLGEHAIDMNRHLMDGDRAKLESAYEGFGVIDLRVTALESAVGAANADLEDALGEEAE